MDIHERKKKLAYTERGLDNAMRRLTLATTVVRRWRARLKTQQRALQSEMEARMTTVPSDETSRRFR